MPVTVAYATADGRATRARTTLRPRGTLRFERGETTKTIEVPIADDYHEEEEETLTLTSATEARIGDRTATGTISNADPLPKALVAGFEGAAAVHVVELVEERVAARRGADANDLQRPAGRCQRYPAHPRHAAAPF